MCEKPPRNISLGTTNKHTYVNPTTNQNYQHQKQRHEKKLGRVKLFA